jgi:hypothetical protein
MLVSTVTRIAVGFLQPSAAVATSAIAQREAHRSEGERVIDAGIFRFCLGGSAGQNSGWRQGHAHVLHTQIVHAHVLGFHSQQRRFEPQPVPPAQSQNPSMQLCPALHVTPQPPQLLELVSGVSQPLASLPSQLPKPALHVPIAHEPLAHVAVALGREQLTPQPPQLLVVVRGVSQPLLMSPSQFPLPAVHE